MEIKLVRKKKEEKKLAYQTNTHGSEHANRKFPVASDLKIIKKHKNFQASQHISTNLYRHIHTQTDTNTHI